MIVGITGHQRLDDPSAWGWVMSAMTNALEDAYLAAGKRIVELADLMIAIWNGQPAKGKGGTADIVAYTIERGTRLIHINPVDRTITLR